MTRIQGAKRKRKATAAKPTLIGISQKHNVRQRFPHLCHICYALTSRISGAQPTIPEAFTNGLRFRKTFVHSRVKRCSFCALLLQSLYAHDIEIEPGVHMCFILVVPGPEEDISVELYDLCTLDLYWEGLIKPGHSRRETRRLGKFMVSATSGSPAAQFLSNRPPILDVVSQTSCDQSKQWLQDCYSHHTDCNLSRTSFIPTRVIDVGGLDGIPRLSKLNDPSAHYAALSYCWGGNQSVMTELDNIDEFFLQLPVSKLQQTLKDAIQTTRELGLRFLWIDSLCIIQNSKDDKIKELSRMHEVYANAYVTIVAANAKDCNEGFLQRREQSSDDPETVDFEAFSLPYRLPNGTFDEVMLQISQSFRPSLEPVNARAWTLQEGLLSPRLLIYGSQLVRQCYSIPDPTFGAHRLSTSSRLMARNPLQVSGLGFAPRRPPSLSPTHGTLPQVCSDTGNVLQQLQWYWASVLTDYSERQLTDVNDKLIAISGIARQLSSTVFKDHSYKAGLWFPNSSNKTSFLCDLCWTTNLPIVREESPYIAPSWSWASFHTPSFSGFRMEKCPSDTGLVETRQICEIVQCAVIAEREDPFAHILGGSLTLKGIVKEARVSRLQGNGVNFEIALPGQIKMPSQLDRLLAFAAAFPSETVNPENADTTRSIFKYILSFSADFDTITPELERDPGSVSVLCLRLLQNAGLLLTPLLNNDFRRVGTFHYKGFDDGYDRVDGCFNGSSTTQVTII